MTIEEIDTMVSKIIATVGQPNARTFEHACQTYNSLFFKGSTADLKVPLCRALADHFAPMQNNFWNLQKAD